jgi:hypothetical protein
LASPSIGGVHVAPSSVADTPSHWSDDMANNKQRGTSQNDAEPRQEDLGRRSFAGENVAADQRRQRRERGAGYGAGSSANRNDDQDVDTTGLPRDGNGDPLGGMTPEDDID